MLRLTAWYAAVLTLVLAAFAFTVYEIVEHRLAAEIDRQLRIAAVRIALVIAIEDLAANELRRQERSIAILAQQE